MLGKALVTPSTTNKKSRRSTSPRAVELRRLQNRIAQRNHRRKLQETNQARKQSQKSAIREEGDQEPKGYNNNTDDDNIAISGSQSRNQEQPTQHVGLNHQLSALQTEPSSSASFAAGSPQPILPLSSEGSNMIIAEDMLTLQEHGVPCMGLIAKSTQETVSPMPQSEMSPQNCTCNAAVGPCIGHLEKMRSQLLEEMMNPLQLHDEHQQQQQQGQHNQDNHVFETHMSRMQTLPSSPLSSCGRAFSSESSQRPLYSPGGMTHLEQVGRLSSYVTNSGDFLFNVGSNSRSSMSQDVPRAILPDTSSSLALGLNKNGTRASTVSEEENTRRFGALLEAMSAAGFPNFDEMVLEYYSARFEVGSLPAMAQCASRSRRIKAMVHNLQQDSRQWPRWESRGLHESLSQASISLCAGEMDEIIKTHAPHPPPQSEPGSLIATLEHLLQSRVQGTPSILDGLKLSGTVEEAVDQMPHLWSLLTELAGSRGLYCDRMAKIVMVILLYARCA